MRPRNVNVGVEIRRARVDDAEAILLAHVDSIRSIGPAFYPQAVVEAWGSGLTPDIYVSAMEGGEAFFVATGHVDGKPAVLGFSTHRVDDAQDGASVYVRGEAARQGIGSALLRLAEQHALEHGATSIEIQASLAGVEFYKANGFDEIGRGDAVLISGCSMPCVFMRKLLAVENVILSTNRAGWNRVAPSFHGSTALPEYGPLAPTEDTLRLIDEVSGTCVLELGCGSGHSLKYLAERGAREVWGLDLSPVQIAFADETLRAFAPRYRLIESPMEVNPGIPEGHFDLVFSIYGMGWTTDLSATLTLVAQYLRPGGCFIVSGEHPAYSCLDWDGTKYVMSKPYSVEGPQEYASWKGIPIVTQRRTLSRWVTEIIGAGLCIEALVEGEFNAKLAGDAHVDPGRWYSAARAQVMPTTFVIKARKPVEQSESGTRP